MSLYAEYLKERTSDLILECESGFATYRYPDDHTVYIVDIYCLPEFRKSGVAKAMADKVVGEAKEKGCTRLLGSVVPSVKNSTVSMKALLAYGLSLDSSTNDFILFKKDI